MKVIRISDSLHTALKEEAERNKRTINAQAELVIEGHLDVKAVREATSPAKRGESQEIDPPIVKTEPIKPAEPGYCPDGHRYVDGRKGCMAKGCKYSIYKRSK